MHRPGRHNVANLLSRNPDFVTLNASLAVTAKSAAIKSSSAAAAAPLGRGHSRDVPASGAKAVPVGKCSKMGFEVPQSVADSPCFTFSSSSGAVAD